MTVQLAYQDTPALSYSDIRILTHSPALSYSDIRILTHSPAQNHTQPVELRMKIAWANSGRLRWRSSRLRTLRPFGDELTPSLTVMLANQC